MYHCLRELCLAIRLSGKEEQNLKRYYSKKTFIVYNSIAAYAAMYLYNHFLFRRFGTSPLEVSYFILKVLVVSAFALGIYLQKEKECNDESVIVNLGWGFGLYTILTYSDLYCGYIIILLLFATALSVEKYLSLTREKAVSNVGKTVKPGKNTIQRRKYQAFLAGQRIFGVILFAIILVPLFSKFINAHLLASQPKVTISKESKRQTAIDNLETLYLLQEEEWAKLSSQEKLNVLQTVADIEKDELGLPDELTVFADNMSHTTSGRYLDRLNVIAINVDMLGKKSSWDLVETICHEAYHSYENRLVEVYDSAGENCKSLMIFDGAKYYKEEFKNYKSGDSGPDAFDDYFFQHCEMDARFYADKSVSHYQELIRINLSDDNEAFG